MLTTPNKPASMSLHQAATIVGSLGGRPSKHTYRGGFIPSMIPGNTLYLNNEPLILNEKYLTLGPADMSIDVSNPGADGQALASAMAALFGGFADYTSTPKRLGLGIPDSSFLRPGPLTVGASSGGVGPELLANPTFNGNADNWELINAQYTDHAVVVIDTNNPGEINQTFDDALPGAFSYRCTVVVANVVDGDNSFTFGLDDSSANVGEIHTDGSYSVDLAASEAFTLFSCEAFGVFEVKEIHLQQISDKVSLSLLHKDGTLAVENVMDNGNQGEPSYVRVFDDSYIIQPGNYFQLMENPVDQGHTTTINHYLATADRTLTLPDADGTVALTPSITHYEVSNLPVIDEFGVLSTFVTDSTVALADGLGQVVVGGGSEFVPVYADLSTNEWKIG